MPKIVAVNRFYWPSETATSQILTDLARSLVSDEAEIHIVTSRGCSHQEKGGLAAFERKDGVAIHRVWTSRLEGASLAGRAIDYLTFYFSASVALARLVRRGDQIVVKTDPPLMSVPAGMVAALRGARVIAWHQDLFPEIAEAVGVVRRNGLLSRVGRWLRNRSARGAAANVVICEGMAAKLREQGVPRQRIRVIPNWCDSSLAPVAPEDNPLRRSWELSQSLVIGYSGNLGRVHQADRIAELVRRTHDIDGLVWLFLGGGVGAPSIKALQDEIGSASLRILPAQPRAALSQSLSVPDLHLVSLDPGCEGLVMPSKLYGIMAVGRPVLNLGARDGAVAREVSRHGFGVSIDPDAPNGWRELVEKLAGDRNRLAEMGRSARRVYQLSYTPEARLSRWQKLLEQPLPTCEVKRAQDRKSLPVKEVG